MSNEGGSERDNEEGGCCGMMEVVKEVGSSGEGAKGIMKEVAVEDDG